MLLSRNFFAALLAVAAIGVKGSPAKLEKRGVGKVVLNTETNFMGSRLEFSPTEDECIPLQCTNLNRDAKSLKLELESGFECSFYE